MATKSFKNHNGVVSITGFDQESRERIEHWMQMNEQKKCSHCCLNCEYYEECKNDHRRKS